MSKSKKVWVADDDESIRFVLEKGLVDAGFEVWGVDVPQRTVDMVKAGKNPTGDPDVDDIMPAPGTPNWHITSSAAEAVPYCDFVLVTVPTPITLDLKPDLSYVEGAGRDVFQAIQKANFFF